MKRLAGLLVLAALVLFGACGEPADDPSRSGSSPSYAGTWELVDGRGPDGDVPVIGGYRVTLEITNGQVGGTSACNSYGGSVQIDDGTFKADGLAGTDMACRPDVMESESAYLAALQQVDHISRAGDALTLTGDEVELHFELVPPVPTADLVDTRWELESLIRGTGDDGIASSAQPAYLVLHGDGTIEGTTGCRDLHGDWQEGGDEILFTTFGADGKCPKELREQDGHVVGALGDGFRAEIDGDHLTVTGRFQTGLVYIAAG